MVCPRFLWYLSSVFLPCLPNTLFILNLTGRNNYYFGKRKTSISERRERYSASARTIRIQGLVSYNPEKSACKRFLMKSLTSSHSSFSSPWVAATQRHTPALCPGGPLPAYVRLSRAHTGGAGRLWLCQLSSGRKQPHSAGYLPDHRDRATSSRLLLFRNCQQIAHLLNRSTSAITVARARMHKKLTGKEGSAEKTDKIILDL